MIAVSLTQLILLGMFCSVGLLAVTWLVSVVYQRRNDIRARRDLVHCRICGRVFQNAEKKEIAACPNCGSLNEATRPKPI